MIFENDKNKGHKMIDVEGVIAAGKQFDLDVVLPKDNRDVIFGIVRDYYKQPVCNAVVKLIEIDFDCGKKVRKPVSHTFTDKDGEFVFGPLCPDKKYEILIWVNQVNHVKICSKCNREMECLKGTCLDKCNFDIECCRETTECCSEECTERG